MLTRLPVPDCSGRDVVIVYCLLPPTRYRNDLSEFSLLSPSERSRASRFHLPWDAAIYSYAHLLLRRCLECVTGTADWDFRLGTHGKPALTPPWGQPPLAFNISHTLGLVACALARGLDVGVDVEAFDRELDPLGLAERYFSVEEQRALTALNPADRSRFFLATWTLKEAVIKADGRGLHMPLDIFTIDPTIPSVRFEPDANQGRAHWRVGRLSLLAHELAVAACGPAPPERFHWIELNHRALLGRLL
jgi:4'-phosphopantetheinyl transferase